MSEGTSPGPEVDPKEDLYRCLTTPAWWVPEEKRPSSAAFRHPSFSADVVSMTDSPRSTLSRFAAGCGLVQFNYGNAKRLGFVARHEKDPEFPDNEAHANVYSSPHANKRKAMAQKLAQDYCTVVVEPSFPT
jgi:hypothetical protein